MATLGETAEMISTSSESSADEGSSGSAFEGAALDSFFRNPCLFVLGLEDATELSELTDAVPLGLIPTLGLRAKSEKRNQLGNQKRVRTQIKLTGIR